MRAPIVAAQSRWSLTGVYPQGYPARPMRAGVIVFGVVVAIIYLVR